MAHVESVGSSSATCDHCQFFDDHHANGQTPGADAGLCRFNPPVTQPQASGHGLWPVVSNRDWCGHYQPEGLGR